MTDKSILYAWQYAEGEDRELENIDPDEAVPAKGNGLSIVISTYVRPHCFKGLLESLVSNVNAFDEIIVVDASPDTSTQQVFSSFVTHSLPRMRCEYIKVYVGNRGIPAQRNIALHRVTNKTLVFLDDDVILDPGCLRHMKDSFASSNDCAGMGGLMRNLRRKTDFFWKIFHCMGGTNTCRAGAYCSSGFSVPLDFMGNHTEDPILVDRLPGCAMMWKTDMARKLRFNERFTGYALGEDLEFSRRAARHGSLMIDPKAQLVHTVDPAGRPSTFHLAKMSVLNRHYIQKTTMEDRTFLHSLWFGYAQLVYSLLSVMGLFWKFRWLEIPSYIGGTGAGVLAVVINRKKDHKPFPPYDT